MTLYQYLLITQLLKATIKTNSAPSRAYQGRIQTFSMEGAKLCIRILGRSPNGAQGQNPWAGGQRDEEPRS